MLELGAGADILRAVGALYWGLIGVLIVLAIWLPKRGWQKALGVVMVLVVFMGPAFKREQEQAQQVDERKARYDKAKALFDERCKTAGEKIYRTVENVEGVFLLNVRVDDGNRNAANPNWPDAGLPNEYGGEAYIYSFLGWEHHEDKRNLRGYLNHIPSDSPGYRYVDTQSKAGAIWRFALRTPGEQGFPSLSKTEHIGPFARYSVAFTNLVNPEDRKYWVAGTTVTVTDVQTSEVLAQATWYSFEPGQGSKAGGRQPWRFALSCPELRGGKERSPTRFFVDQVLKPKKVD